MTWKLKSLIPTEDHEAQCLAEWSRVARYAGKPLSDYLVLQANDAMGGIASPLDRAIRMKKLKSKGLRLGAADYFLALPKPPFAGLWIELKRTKGGVLGTDQMRFLNLMDSVGFKTCVAKGWERAREEIEAYLKGKA